MTDPVEILNDDADPALAQRAVAQPRLQPLATVPQPPGLGLDRIEVVPALSHGAAELEDGALSWTTMQNEVIPALGAEAGRYQDRAGPVDSQTGRPWLTFGVEALRAQRDVRPPVHRHRPL